MIDTEFSASQIVDLEVWLDFEPLGLFIHRAGSKRLLSGDWIF